MSTPELVALPVHTPRPAPPTMLAELKERFGDRCSTALAVREQHGRDESPFDVPPPEAVVFAESTAEVAEAVALAARHRVPVIPYGVGSSLEGHLLAVQGGISIDLSRMNRVLRLNAEDLTVTVQPGVTRMQLNNEIRHSGLFFPDRPRRRCVDRRHGGHARQWHQRRALRHHARQRAGAGGGDSRWRT
jgi:D-lactate dehydrogenase (cytochrome)